MPSFSNSTLSSTPDRDKAKYWASYSEKPFSCGDRLQVYEGKLNGKGPRQGDFAVVKVFSDSAGTQARCQAEMAKSEAGSCWLARFLRRGGFHPDSVRLVTLLAAPVDRVSLLNKFLASRRSRNPKGGEWVLVEEMIGRNRGKDSDNNNNSHNNLVRFVDKRGRVFRDGADSDFDSGRRGSGRGRASSSRLSCSRSSAYLRDVVEAFVHFVHQASGGQEVVCGLEGQVAGEEDAHERGPEEAQLVLKTPVIHSYRGDYGATDRGPAAVRDVMKNHVCNRLCQRVLGLNPNNSSSSSFSSSSSISSSPTSSSSLSSSASSGSFLRGSPLPSAPYDPDVVAPARGDDDVDFASCPRTRRRSGSSSGPPPLTMATSPPSYDDLGEPDDVAGEPRMMFYLELEPTCPESPPPPYSEIT